MAKIAFGRYFVMSDTVKPGHVLKWPRFIARRKEDGVGLNAAPWRKRARSVLVVQFRTALLAYCFG